MAQHSDCGLLIIFLAFLTLFSAGFSLFPLPPLQPFHTPQPPPSGISNSGAHLLSNILACLQLLAAGTLALVCCLSDFLFPQLFVSVTHLELCV